MTIIISFKENETQTNSMAEMLLKSTRAQFENEFQKILTPRADFFSKTIAPELLNDEFQKIIPPQPQFASREMFIKDTGGSASDIRVIPPQIMFNTRFPNQIQQLYIDTTALRNFPHLEIREVICELDHRKHFSMMKRSATHLNLSEDIKFDQQFSGVTTGILFTFQMPHDAKTDLFSFHFSLWDISTRPQSELPKIDPQVGNDPSG